MDSCALSRGFAKEIVSIGVSNRGDSNPRGTSSAPNRLQRCSTPLSGCQPYPHDSLDATDRVLYTCRVTGSSPHGTPPFPEDGLPVTLPDGAGYHCAKHLLWATADAWPAMEEHMELDHADDLARLRGDRV